MLTPLETPLTRLTMLSKTLDFDICGLENTEEFYIDGVHFTHEGNLELAKRFYNAILDIRKNK